MNMFRLLGILSLGHLLFGGGRRRALRRGLLLGALLGYLANRNGGADRVAEKARETAREARRAARDAARAVRREIHDARRTESRRRTEEHLWQVHAEIDARRAEREARRAERETAAAREAFALPECDTREAKEIRELAEDLDRDARTAAMAASVPVIEFPEEDGRYHTERKYGYV